MKKIKCPWCKSCKKSDELLVMWIPFSNCWYINCWKCKNLFWSVEGRIQRSKPNTIPFITINLK